MRPAERFWQSDPKECALNPFASWLLKAGDLVGTQNSATRVEESNDMAPTAATVFRPRTTELSILLVPSSRYSIPLHWNTFLLIAAFT